MSRAPAAISVEASRRGTIATYYSATASLGPDKEAEIPARVNGVLKAPLVEEGDDVGVGQVLLEIEDAEYRHRRTQAEIDRAQQKSVLARTEKMLKQGLVAPEVAEAERSKLKATEAAWELADLELSYTRVRAPFAGRIVARLVDEGQTVSPGISLFKIADLSRLLARVQVPAREFRNIRTDQRVELRVDSTGDRLKGRIFLISPVVDSTTGTIKVTVAVEKYPRTTRPGDFAEVSIVTDRHENALLVPRIAVLSEHEENIVYLVEDSKAVRRKVKTGFEDEENMEIISGLNEGERVVVQGQRSLSDGQEVRILDRLDLENESPTED